MANPLFGLLGGNNQTPNGSNNMFAQFKNFMGQMQGKNPQEVLNQLIQNNHLSQEQLNMFQQKANEISSQLDGFKSMFGFK